MFQEGLSDCLKFIMEEGSAFEFGGNDSNRDQLLVLFYFKNFYQKNFLAQAFPR